MHCASLNAPYLLLRRRSGEAREIGPVDRFQAEKARQGGATLHTHGAIKTRINPDVQTRDAPALLSCPHSLSLHIDPELIDQPIHSGAL